jgi:DNA-binding XRE family transcriptional regulator
MIRLQWRNRAQRPYGYCVPATASANDGATSATWPRLRVEVFDRRCEELGALTEAAKAELVDVDRVTLHRYRKGEMGARLEVAMRFAQRLDMTVEQLWGQP